jgi:hypothetical protein
MERYVFFSSIDAGFEINVYLILNIFSWKAGSSLRLSSSSSAEK